MNNKPASFAAAGTVLLWASAFPAITVAVRGLGPAGLAVARLAVASGALAAAAPVLGVRRPRLRDLPLIALCGLAGMTGYQLLLNAGERVVSAGTASLLVATAPVYASLLAVAFLGERSSRRRWAGSAVALAGTALIAASHGLGFGASALVVLAAAVLQGIFHTAQKPLLARYTGFEVTAYAMWAGTVFILPWTGSLLRALPHAGAAAVGSAVFLGLAPSAAGFVLWAYAMARMDVGRVTVSLYLVPAAAIGISLVWLGQVPGPAELIGGAIALAGVVLASGGPTSNDRASGVPAGDDDRGRGQRRGRPGQHDQQGPARGEQVRRRVQHAHLLGRRALSGATEPGGQGLDEPAAEVALAAVGSMSAAGRPGREGRSLTDLDMPGMTGLELLGALRQVAPGLPVAVVSAHALDGGPGRAARPRGPLPGEAAAGGPAHRDGDRPDRTGTAFIR
jgi:drug/metabolite transporter (DMT)-like permease/CheY-like chemotaxis protein